jgi:hypothetical protein
VPVVRNALPAHPLKAIKATTQSFDAIFMHHTLPHFSHPSAPAPAQYA